MIIKPIETKNEFEQYYAARFDKYKAKFPAFIKKNEITDNLEMDTYDQTSFHFAAYNQYNEPQACSRLVPDTFGNNSQSTNYSEITKQYFLERRKNTKSTYSMSFIEFLTETESSTKVEKFFSEKRDKGLKFLEIGRLINIHDKANARLINYMLCYAWAVGIYIKTDLCFFEATPAHCKYYERYFNCKKVLEDYSFNPNLEGNINYIMQATVSNQNSKMEATVNKMVNEFYKKGYICPISTEILN